MARRSYRFSQKSFSSAFIRDICGNYLQNISGEKRLNGMVCI